MDLILVLPLNKELDIGYSQPTTGVGDDALRAESLEGVRRTVKKKKKKKLWVSNETLEKTWTEEAREASAEARHHNPEGRSASDLLKGNEAVDLGAIWTPPMLEKVKEIKDHLAQDPETADSVEQGGFKLPTGGYTPERQAVHAGILGKLFSKENVIAATPKLGEQPTLTILAGRPGAGKTSSVKAGALDTKHAIYIGADDLMAELPGYKGWNAALTHEEGSDIANLAEKLAKSRGLNVIYDGTMGNLPNSIKRLEEFKNAGYKEEAVYVYAPPQTAARRAAERFMKTGRYVPPERSSQSLSNEGNFDKVKDRLNRWRIYDNSGEGGPTLYAEGGRG